MIRVQNSNATPHQGFPGKSQRRSNVNLNPLISKGWDVGVYTCIYAESALTMTITIMIILMMIMICQGVGRRSLHLHIN